MTKAPATPRIARSGEPARDGDVWIETSMEGQVVAVHDRIEGEWREVWRRSKEDPIEATIAAKAIGMALHQLHGLHRDLPRMVAELGELQRARLRDRMGQAIADAINNGAEEPDWHDAREIDRLANAAYEAILNTLQEEPQA
jgi:hypothetical protein